MATKRGEGGAGPRPWLDVNAGTIISLIGVVASVIIGFALVSNMYFGRIDQFAGQMDARFGMIDTRFDDMAARFDARFDAIEQRFDAMDTKAYTRYEALVQRFDIIDKRMARMDQRQDEETRAWRAEARSMQNMITDLMRNYVSGEMSSPGDPQR